METPRTLQQAIIFYADTENCIAFLSAKRWPDGVVKCPVCGSNRVAYVTKRKVWQCKTRHPKSQFSIKVGTIFEDSSLGLDKWLTAMWLMANSKNGVSSHEVARSLGITQKSAWHMVHRIRLAMKDDFFTKMGSNEGGEVEVDEAYVGAKVKNMHYSRKIKIQKELSEIPAWKNTQRYSGKTPVMGMFDRESRQVRAKVVPNTKRETLQTEILNGIEHGSKVYTDQAVAYDKLATQYVHETVNHANTYVRGQVHTNCLENFWSLMKRNLAGTYVAVEPYH